MNKTNPCVGACLVIACMLTASGAISATITNPSFETDVFAVAPGAISANGPITGWTASDDTRVGLNPAGGTNVFANNGAVPDGVNVAYVQSDTFTSIRLDTKLTDLDVGQTYKVDFRFNTPLNQSPSVRLALDGSELVGLQTTHVGGTAPYRYGAVTFPAAATNQTLSLYNVTLANNQALLLDDFRISAYTSGWSFAAWSDDASSDISTNRVYTHAYSFGSTNSTVINGVPFRGVVGANPGDPARFSTAGFGSQWGRNGLDIDDNVITRAGGDSAVLAGQFVYNGLPQSLTIHGLVPGVEYVATLYSVAWDPDFRPVVFNVGEDRLTINQDHFGTDEGIRVSYRYVAPESGSITLSASRYTVRSLHLYGFSNYTLQPEPGISRQPKTQIAAVGNTSYLRVLAGGPLPFFYRWRKDGSELAGETNAALTLAVTGTGDAGDYTVVVTNTYGAVTSDVATVSIGMIANPSFEADTFYDWPGYIGNPANVPISGWTASNPLRIGINPLDDGISPFANDGAIPDGGQVAFIQGVETQGLSTVISGLTTGETYRLTFRTNRRNQGNTPGLHAYVDDQAMLDANVTSVGGANPYRYVAFDFTATAPSHVLALTNDTAADSSVLVDDFRIAPSSKRWSYAVWTNDASSGVVADDNYSHAYNFATWESPEINGVRFAGIAGPSPADAGRFAATGLDAQYFNDVNTMTTNGGGSAVLGRDFLYQGNTPGHSIAISGLVTGAEYEVTIYGAGFDNAPITRAATFSVGDDRMTVNENGFGNNMGIRVSHRYVADAGGSVTLNYMPLNGPSSFHTYGFSNRELSPAHAPVIYAHPAAAYVAFAGEALEFSTRTGGMQPLFHQWRRDGTTLASQTNATLSILGLRLGDAGVYTLVVSNAAGTVVSSNAVLEVGLPMATLFNTGVDASGAPLAGGSVDPHYELVASADTTWTGPDAYTSVTIPGSYMADGPDSMWISPRPDLGGACTNGIYAYRTTFAMTGFSTEGARIEGQWAMDNAGLDIVFNGASLGAIAGGFGAFTPFSITAGFVPGTNTIDFVIENHPPPGPTGLRVEMQGIAQPGAPGTLLILR